MPGRKSRPRADLPTTSTVLTLSRLAPRHFLALPSVAWTLLFFLAPLILIALYSFATEDLVTFQVSFGWTTENYGFLISSLYIHTLVRSLVLSAGTTLACALIGFPFAYVLSRASRRWQTVLLIAVIVPFWTSFLVRTYAWIVLLQNNGPIESFLRWLGLLDGHLNLLYTPVSIGIGIVYGYLPLMILPIYVALERIEPEVVDAASDLGATGWSTFKRVIFPLGLPGLIAGIIIVGIPATGEYVIPEILGGGKTLMVGNILVDQFLNLGNYPFGSAIAMALMVLLLVVAFVLRRAQPDVDATAA
jgi:spermidine/putrescine transport system permease protein